MSKSSIVLFSLILFLLSEIRETEGNNEFMKYSNEVDIEEFPWQVTLISSSEYGGLPCGGAIISKRHVLTAALCTYFEPIETIHVFLGSSIFEEGLQYKLKRIHNHPNFTTNFPFPHNIAVLELDGEIEFDEKKNFIQISDKDVPLDAEVIVTGFGLEAWNTYPNYLKVQELKIVENDVCNAIIEEVTVNVTTEKFGNLNEAQACATTSPNLPICQANMGGAVVWKNSVVGIVTWAISCQESSPEIFTRVYNHLDWIRDKMNH